jgi:hypothetical protein
MLVVYGINTGFAKEYNLTFFTQDRGRRTTFVFHFTLPAKLGRGGVFLNAQNATLSSFSHFV